MTVKLNPPSSAVVVTVADEAAEKYLSAGWTKVKPKARPKPTRTEEEKADEAPARRRSSRSR